MKPADKSIPRMLGRYHVLEAVDRDAWGTIHLARFEGAAGFQRWASLRRVDPGLARDRAFVDSFFESARAAVRLQHPNVVATLDVGEEGGVLWHAVEHVLGESVRDLLEESRRLRVPVPWDIACRIVADAALGLGAVHELRDGKGRALNLVHGAVVPDNVVVSYDGKAKVVDPVRPRALIALAASDPDLLPYSAPETVWGDRVDARADQFGLGVILWELCAGRPLFRGRNEDETRALLEAHVVPPLREVVRSYPEVVEEIVRRTLASRPGDRYTNARSLARALQAALVREAIVVTDDDVGRYVRTLFEARLREKELRLQSASDLTEVFVRGGPPAADTVRDVVDDVSGRAVDFSDSGETKVLLRDEDSETRVIAAEEAHAPGVAGLLPPANVPPRPRTERLEVRPAAGRRELPVPPPQRLLQPLPPTPLPHARVAPAFAATELAPAVSQRPASSPSPAPPPVNVTAPLVYAPMDRGFVPPPHPGLTMQQGHGGVMQSPMGPPGGMGMPGPMGMPMSPVVQTAQTRSADDPSRPLLIAALALSVVAAGAIVYMRLRGRPEEAPRSRATPPAATTVEATAAATTAPPPLATGFISGGLGTVVGTAGQPAGVGRSSQPGTPPAASISPPAVTRSSRSSSGRSHTSPATGETPDPPAPPPPPAGASRGQLTVVCMPACDEVLDGSRSLGASPIFKRTVSAGPHHLTLRSSDPPAERIIDVTVREDDVTVVRQTMGN